MSVLLWTVYILIIFYSSLIFRVKVLLIFCQTDRPTCRDVQTVSCCIILILTIVYLAIQHSDSSLLSPPTFRQFIVELSVVILCPTVEPSVVRQSFVLHSEVIIRYSDNILQSNNFFFASTGMTFRRNFVEYFAILTIFYRTDRHSDSFYWTMFYFGNCLFDYSAFR